MPIPSSADRAKHQLEPSQAIHALLIRSLLFLSSELQKRLDVYVRPFDLTMQRMGVLFILYFAEEQLSPSEIGDRLFVTRGNMTGLIESLVTDGLVRRVRRPNDRRAHDIALTERGRAIVEEYFPHHLAGLDRLMSGLTPEEGLQLAKLLQKLRSGMVVLEPVKRNAPDDDRRVG